MYRKSLIVRYTRSIKLVCHQNSNSQHLCLHTTACIDDFRFVDRSKSTRFFETTERDEIGEIQFGKLINYPWHRLPRRRRINSIAIISSSRSRPFLLQSTSGCLLIARTVNVAIPRSIRFYISLCAFVRASLLTPFVIITTMTSKLVDLFE